jgi:glycosyltransferase involved in cell wall biosynthesis
VIASQMGPGPELIEDGISGVLVNPKDPDAIADALYELLGNPQMRTILGSRARERAEALFSNDVLIPRNLAFYQDCLNG